MVDHVEKVCCMCGDIGFPDKLFRCNSCHNRFQHSYCSNYNSESSEIVEVCDWCQSEEKSSRSYSTSSSKKGMARHGASKLVITKRSTSSEQLQFSTSGKVKKNEESSDQKGKSPTAGTPSPRTATRRYKLLKDVMC